MRLHASYVKEKRGFGESYFVRNDGVAATSNNFGFRTMLLDSMPHVLRRRVGLARVVL